MLTPRGKRMLDQPRWYGNPGNSSDWMLVPVLAFEKLQQSSTSLSSTAASNVFQPRMPGCPEMRRLIKILHPENWSRIYALGLRASRQRYFLIV